MGVVLNLKRNGPSLPPDCTLLGREVRIDEFNESVVTATISDIERRMQLIEQAKQGHGAWFDTCLALARSIGFLS